MSKNKVQFSVGDKVILNGNQKHKFIITCLVIDGMHYFIKPESEVMDDSRGELIHVSKIKKAPAKINHITRGKPKVKTKGKKK
jgi:hypothetical protein